VISKSKLHSRRRVQPTISALLALCTFSASLTGCSSKPGASDVEPFVMEDLGACPLWKISDVRNTNSVAQGDRYKVDFAATLTFNDSPEKVWEDSKRDRSIASTPACNVYFIVLIQQPGGSYALPERQVAGATLSQQYKVAGYATLVKSEKGWQIIDEIRGLSFEPVADGRQRSAQVVPANAAAEPQPTSSTNTQDQPLSCVDERMRDWDKKRMEEIDRYASDAQARGEEVRVSAGSEELIRSEALAQYTAECERSQ
jgi:hypothetical protein